VAQHLTVLTRKGQITIPVEYRRVLNLQEGDKLAVSLVNGRMEVVPGGSVAAETAGMFGGTGPVLSAEELRAAAEQAIADSAVERLDE
jgi:AbrB family looped-hinge helix DNA binding protein